jgi:hypothetical protein
MGLRPLTIGTGPVVARRFRREGTGSGNRGRDGKQGAGSGNKLQVRETRDRYDTSDGFWHRREELGARA